MTELTDLGIAAIRDGVRAGDFSAREVAEAFVAAVAAAKPLNAFLVETPDHALAAADAADAARAAGDAPRPIDRKSTRLNSSHSGESRMPSSA